MHGLNLEIDIEGRHYLRNGVTANEGIAIVVHHDEDIPVISSQSFDIQPNTATSVVIEHTVIKRLASPYKSLCTADWTGSQFPDTDPRIKYQSKLCLSMCVENLIEEECGCAIPQMLDKDIELLSQEDFLVHVPFCNLLGSDGECVGRASKSGEVHLKG